LQTGLGTWRFFLAAVVAISHLWAGMIDGPAAYAVWGFFVLSGYLMTLVLTTKYGTAPAGLRQFATNRLLRIYPSFIVAAMLGIATVLALRPLGIDPAGLNPQFMLPQNTSDWLSNLAMVPFVAQQGLPVSVAAALFVEVWAYALMPLFASSRGAAFLGLAVAICANLQFGFGMPTFIPRYCGFHPPVLRLRDRTDAVHRRCSGLPLSVRPAPLCLAAVQHSCLVWAWPLLATRRVLALDLRIMALGTAFRLGRPLSGRDQIASRQIFRRGQVCWGVILPDLPSSYYGRGLVPPPLRFRTISHVLCRIIRRDPSGLLVHAAPG
jgi:hypothetical protein